jgi:signal transduction histidine kinase/ligand-binding sensor domain-containing protein/DNA-binding response OmpR family regulator
VIIIKNIFIILICFTLAGVLFASEGAYIFDHITRKEGLSNSSISSIVQDKDGFMWFGTQGGLNRYDGKNVKLYEHNPYDENSLPHRLIQTMFLDYEKNILWIGTYNGLARFDIYKETFKHYPHIPKDKFSLSNEVVTAITTDNEDNVWVGTLNGLNVLNPETGEIKHYFHDSENSFSLSDDTVRSILKDSKGRIWVGTYHGLNLYHAERDDFTRYTPENTDNLKSPYIMSLSEDEQGHIWIGNWGEGIVEFLPDQGVFKDSIVTDDNRIYVINAKDNGRIWAGTWGGGIYEYVLEKKVLNKYVYDQNNLGSISHDVVYSIFLDNSDLLWIGTNGNGLNRLNKDKIDYRRFSYDPQSDVSLSHGKVNSIIEDHRGDLWFGIYDGGLNRYNPNEDKMTVYRNDPNTENSLSNDIVTFIYEDSDNNIWVGTNEGLNLYKSESDDFDHYLPDGTNNNPSGTIPYAMVEDDMGNLWIGYYKNGVDNWNRETGQFQNYRMDADDLNSLSDNLVYWIIQDREGDIWIGTNNGLNCFDPDSEEFVSYFNDPDDINSLSNNTARMLMEDSKGRIWIGTTSGGVNLYDKEKDAFLHYNGNNGLSDNAILSMLEDDKGDIWVATSYGINIIDPETGVITLISEEDGLWGMEFNSGHLKTSGGNLLFGSMHGVYSFRSSPNKVNFYKPKIQIVEIMVMNEPLKSNGPYYLLEDIDLSYNENFLSFEFISIDYHAPSKNQYAYRLSGVDNDWVYIGTRNYVSYSNLSPGQYEFQVKASNSDGVWNENPKVLSIMINPPPWRSWWAYLIYIASIAAVIYFIKLATDLKIKKEKAEISNKEKTEFLANMSHEIRTPMNSIIGFSKLLKQSSLNDTQKQYLESVNASAQSLLGIINDILDLSKIEAGKLELEMIKTDINEIINKSIEIIRYPSFEKNLELLLEIQPDIPRFLVTDPTRLRQILINLMGNAVKFTEKGEVKLKVNFEKIDEKKGKFTFSVSDTGIGISKDQMKKIFSNFSQGDISITRKFGGSGLGLAISNLLVQKLGGKLELNSVPEAGSKFSFSLLTEYDGYNWFKEETTHKYSHAVIISNHSSLTGIISTTLNHLEISSDQFESAKVAYEESEKSYKYDLMIIDSDMEDEDLLDTLQTIRQKESENNKKMEIILLHSPKIAEIQQDELNAIDLKCSLLKPLNPRDLHECFKGDRQVNANEQKEIEKYRFNRPPRILIAEDVAMNMLLFKTILAKYLEGVRIWEASNGYEALQLVKNNRFDFVLMDLRMPEMDGIEATKKIREFEKGVDYHTPIVALTASAIREDEIRSLESGMDEFLSKPVDENKLIKCFLEYVKPLNSQIRTKTKEEQTTNEVIHFDREKLLRKISQDKETLKEILKTAKADFESRLSLLGHAVGENKKQNILKEAHAIKGSAFEICLMKFGEIAKLIETESDDINKVKENYQKLISEWEIVNTIIEEELK